MKKVKKGAIFFLAVLTVGLSAVISAAAQYGAASVRESESYTLAQMLTYAIEDEYLASARYTAYIDKYGDIRLLTRIADAEKRHIALLKPMFAKYEVPLPEDKSAQFMTVPATLQAALKTCADAERENMRMYDALLKQELPEDVRLVFSLLRGAAERHLQAFERNLARFEGTRRS